LGQKHSFKLWNFVRCLESLLKISSSTCKDPKILLNLAKVSVNDLLNMSSILMVCRKKAFW
jgi:rRNA pseudouridine-1189 N-methylase Emg1 (Nep1/Mra1 family)